MDKQSITLLSCDHFKKDITDCIAEDIHREFHSAVILQEYNIDISIYYNPRRRQYDANGILQAISSITSNSPTKTIALFRVDLFVPILTYIFGQAFLNGKTAIASFHRLRNEHYGLKKDNAIRNERLRKVVIHEIGHMFGLIHCHNPVCVMRSSTYVEDIDQKEIHFCQKCQTQLNQSRK